MYKCKCCGHETLPVPPEEAVAYICPICRWENDVFTADDDEPSDENHGLSLNQGRRNYREHGICDTSLREPNGNTTENEYITQSTASEQIIGGSYRCKPTADKQTGETK